MPGESFGGIAVAAHPMTSSLLSLFANGRADYKPQFSKRAVISGDVHTLVSDGIIIIISIAFKAHSMVSSAASNEACNYLREIERKKNMSFIVWIICVLCVARSSKSRLCIGLCLTITAHKIVLLGETPHSHLSQIHTSIHSSTTNAYIKSHSAHTHNT